MTKMLNIKDFKKSRNRPKPHQEKFKVLYLSMFKELENTSITREEYKIRLVEIAQGIEITSLSTIYKYIRIHFPDRRISVRNKTTNLKEYWQNYSRIEKK